MSDLIALARRHKHIAPTHYEGCEADHIGCLVNKLADDIEGLRADNERLFNEDTKTRHALKGWVFVCPDGGDEPTHERVAAVVAEVEKQRADNERLTGKLKLVANALNETISKYHEVGDQNDRLDAENERLRAALMDMLAGWRYIRETYGDLAGIGWDRAESKARNALEGKP